MTESEKPTPRPLAHIRCAVCGVEVERLTMAAPVSGQIEFIAECHGARQTLLLDEAQLVDHKIVGGEAFGDHPGIDLRPWGDGFAP